MSETNKDEVRNCLGCEHYKHYKEDIFSCESWECNYKPRKTEEVEK